MPPWSSRWNCSKSSSSATPRAGGFYAAQIRAYRPPEPYKGKGVKYIDETIIRKEGKKK